ncbi:MAG TPA: tetratricopeptide repeat protein [Planctomycetota bacterium]
MLRRSAPLLLVGLASLARAQGSADEQYRYLAGLVEKGLSELAVEEARAFLRDHARHEKAPLARYRLAGALWELERRAEAVREYEALARLERFEYRAECLFRLGEAARADGDAARARKAFEGVLASGAGNQDTPQEYLLAPALLALAELELAERNLDQAEARYGALLAQHGASPEAAHARSGLAWCAWERGDADETARRARAYLAEEREPARRDELRLLLGEALLASDPEGARAAFEALETPAQAEAGLRGRAFALAAQGDHAGAARAFERLLARAPEGRFAAEAALQAGVEHVRAGAARAALPHLARAASGGGGEALYWLAQAQKLDGQPEEALRTLERALAARPAAEEAARLHALRGDCLTASGRTAEARAAYEASGSARALEAGAVSALSSGDARAAVRLAEQALRQGADGPRAQELALVLAEALFAARDYPAAESHFSAALARATPEDRARIALRLGWCRYLAGDLAAARARFAAVAAEHPRAPEAEEALALELEIALAQGETDTARALARRALERYPQGRFADQAFLVEARALEGPEARKRLAQWLERFPQSPRRAAVLLELAEREAAAGAHVDAARRYAEVEALAPGTGEARRALYGRAWSAWEQRALEECRALLATLVADSALEPELGASARELALWLEVERGDLAAATQAWRALRAAGIDEARRLEGARALLAALRRARRFDEARALLEECARTLETRALAGEVWLESAYLALDEGDVARAEAALEKARKAGADGAKLAEASYHAGEARLAAGDAPRALALLARAAEGQGPRAADALYRIGFAQLAADEPAAAAQAFARLLEEHPGAPQAPEARFLLGECAYRAGDFAAAARHCRAAREAPGIDATLRAKALFREGLALGALERWSECSGALAELARTFPAFPNLAEAELWRGRALAAQAEGRAARAAFERTLALDQGELAARARLGLGALAEAEGRAEDALSEYLKVALLYAHEPSVAEALFAAGRVLEARGDADQARARYEELVAEHPGSPFAARAREKLRALSAAPRGERSR